jgi:hypothetical protein
LVPLPGTNQDWVDLTGGFAYTLGLQRDGTVLGWESNYGGAGAPIALTPVGTNFLWRAISALGPFCIGVSSDGRLWTWERRGSFPLTFSQPVQESTITNWIGVADERFAWSSSGELWGTPVARLNSPNAIQGRFALGSVVHEIRSDSTLWAIGEPGQPMFRQLVDGGASFSAAGHRSGPNRNGLPPDARKFQWRKVGNRSDWVSIWGAYDIYFGLTSDGTVWVWGSDWGQQPIETMKDKLNRLWEEIRDRFQASPRGAGIMGARPLVMLTQPYQDEPRPLMRFKPATK